MKKKFNTRQGFRPLAGDLSSLPEDTKEAFTSWDAFPSPCRGLIFLTDGDRYQTYFYDGFRPLAGDLSSLQCIYDALLRHDRRFRPLAGDLSSLRKRLIRKLEKSGFPSPCRGLIFLTQDFQRDKMEDNGFRPLAGDLSSLPRPCNTRVSVCFHCTLRGKKKISLSSSFFSCSTSAKWPIPGHRGKFL